MSNKPFPPRNRRLHTDIMRYMREGLEKIEFDTHRAEFSLYSYDFFELQKVLNLKNPPQKNKKNSKYNLRYEGKFCGKNVKLLAFSKIPWMPPYRIIIADTNVDIFQELYHIFGESIKISKVEYKLDFYCKDNIYAGIVYANLLRYIHFKNKKETSIAGGNFIGLDVERHENCVFHVWNDKEFKRTYITIYERGPDHLKKWNPFKKKHYWDHKDVDRVRFEYKVGRKKDSKSVNLRSLGAFLKDPGFYQVMMPLMNFKIFKEHNALPGPYADHYMAEDEDGHSEIFQQEYLAAKNKRGLSPSTYIQKPEGMEWLLNMVGDALLKAERAWKRKALGKKRKRK